MVTGPNIRSRNQVFQQFCLFGSINQTAPQSFQLRQSVIQVCRELPLLQQNDPHSLSPPTHNAVSPHTYMQYAQCTHILLYMHIAHTYMPKAEIGDPPLAQRLSSYHWWKAAAHGQAKRLSNIQWLDCVNVWSLCNRTTLYCVPEPQVGVEALIILRCWICCIVLVISRCWRS